MKKKITALAAFLLLTLASLLLCTSCGGPEEISIDPANMPQTVFVEGNDPDFSRGALLADGKSVSLADPAVTIEGYDKTRLGEQTLTVTYQKVSTELKVTVVPRVQTAESYLYFVGETQDAISLRFKVTRDDGTSFSVSAGDEGVTLTGFSADAPSDALPLSFVCQKDGETYSGSFTVTVVNPDISFKKPRKTAYGSHETALDLTGATLTLKNADGKTTRSISNSELVMEGYQPARANADTPTVTETITVKWHGREVASFDVSITYSDISRIKDAASLLSAVDWAHYEFPVNGVMYLPAAITENGETLGKLSLEALELYCTITEKDLTYVTPAEADAIARTAIIYGYNTWNKLLADAYGDVFTLSIDNGSLYFTYTCKEIATARAGYEKLLAKSDEDTVRILKYSDLLKNERLKEVCGETVIYDGAEVEGESVTLSVGDMMTLIYDASFFTKVRNVLEKMISLPTLLTVPAEWTADALPTYAASIDAVYDTLFSISQSDASAGVIYEYVNDWREGGDFFEILYRYYYGVSVASDKTAAEAASKKIDQLIDFYLPGKLEELRIQVLSTALLQSQMAYYAQYASEYGLTGIDLMESTMFFSFYQDTMDLVTELLTEKDPLYLELYSRAFAGAMISVQFGEYGYYTLQTSSAFDKVCNDLLLDYLALWEKVETDKTYVNGTQFGTEIDAIFRTFVGLSPKQQYNVLAAIHYLYAEQPVYFTALYPTDGSLYSEFATFIYAYYLDALGVDISSEEEDPLYDLFTGLMFSLECYANGDYNGFGASMKGVKATYAALSDDRKALFDGHLDFLYQKYDALFAAFTEKAPAEGEDTPSYVYGEIALDDATKALFDELSNALLRTSFAKLFIEDLSDFNIQVELYLAYLSAYEHVRDCESRILAITDENVLRAYYEQVTGQGAFPYYSSVYDAKGYYSKYLLLLGVDETIYEQSEGLRTFLYNYDDYLWSAVTLLYSTGGLSDPLAGQIDYEMNAQTLSEMMAAFRVLSADEKYLMLSLDTLNLYYGGLQAYCATVWSSSAKLSELAGSLFAAEIAYFTYEVFPNETLTVNGATVTMKEYVLSVWDTFYTGERGYQSLTSDQKAEFNALFEEMTEYYAERCDLLAAEE